MEVRAHWTVKSYDVSEWILNLTRSYSSEFHYLFHLSINLWITSEILFSAVDKFSGSNCGCTERCVGGRGPHALMAFISRLQFFSSDNNVRVDTSLRVCFFY